MLKALKFGREVRAEAAKVTWPKWAETQRMSLVVLAFVAVMSVFLVTIDFLANFGIQLILGV